MNAFLVCQHSKWEVTTGSRENRKARRCKFPTLNSGLHKLDPVPQRQRCRFYFIIPDKNNSNFCPQMRVFGCFRENTTQIRLLPIIKLFIRSKSHWANSCKDMLMWRIFHIPYQNIMLICSGKKPASALPIRSFILCTNNGSRGRALFL